jgi:hypothetical protein
MSVTTPDAFIFMGQCNAGKRSNIEPKYSFLDIVSCVSGRTAWGSTNTSACYLITEQVEGLDGPNSLVAPDVVSSNPSSLPEGPASFTCAHDSAPAQLSP